MPVAWVVGLADHRHLERRADEPLDRPEQVRERGGVLAHHRRQRRDPALGRAAASASPVSAASRSSPLAASEFSDGVALSWKSLGRTISASASMPVVKNPPLSSSANSRTSSSATARASASQATSSTSASVRSASSSAA